MLLTGAFARSDAFSDSETLAGIAQFTEADRAWDADRFAVAVEMLKRAASNRTNNVTNHYWLGVALFHRALCLQHSPGASTNKPIAEATLGTAVEALARAVELDNRHAESHALLGTIYGMKIDGNLARAAWFGPRVQKHRKAAMKFGADNPRVVYLLGTCQLHTAKKPAALREALATFRKAKQLFEAEAKVIPGPLDPRWGYASCLTFIGRNYELLGELEEAAAAYRCALVERPADHLAKEGSKRVAQKD